MTERTRLWGGFGEVILGTLFLLFSCVCCSTVGPGEKEVCDLDRPLEEGQDGALAVVFNCSPIEKVELYLWSIHRSYPPNHGIGDLIAADGEDLVEAVLIRLRRARDTGDDSTVLDLLIMLEVMHDEGHYDVRSDGRLENEFVPAVRELSHPEVGEWHRDLVLKLWRESIPDPPEDPIT